MNKLRAPAIIAGAIFVGLLFGSNNINAACMDMVDVSNHNGYMSTAEYVSMRNEFGVKAVTVKISEGTTYQDPYAKSNVANVQAAGLYVNGYHFARYQTKVQAIAEADYAGQTAKAAGLPVGAVLATDVEAPQQGVLSKATNNANNQAFMNEIEKYGYRSDVYTMGSWVGVKMDLKQGTGWPANYPKDPSNKNWYSGHHAWQYQSDGHFRISSGDFDISQLYDDYYTAGQKSTVNEQNKTSNTHNQKNNTSANWVKENKTYTLVTPVKLRTGASTSSSVITTLPTGSTIKTDQAIIQNGYRWVRQPRSNGYAYMATGPASDTLEYVKSGASHTYYTVKSGDSWWGIAQLNGLNVYTLVTQNSKSINSTIYPGNKLMIN